MDESSIALLDLVLTALGSALLTVCMFVLNGIRGDTNKIKDKVDKNSEDIRELQTVIRVRKRER